MSGILAAIDLLRLDAEKGGDLEASLDEMRTSVIRSKQLVEIFLGFSQESLQAAAVGNVYDSFKQAHQLIRFRSVEAGFHFETGEHRLNQKFAKMINPSIMAMVLFSFKRDYDGLCSFRAYPTRTTLKQRLLGFEEEEDRVRLVIENPLGQIVRVPNSKLMDHLLKLEKLNLRVLGNGVELVVSEGFL